MLSYALAIAVALSSLVLFSTAFVMSNLHRKDDFLWSGVGLFYALILWYCAKNITGTVLLGQAAASILLVSYSWQILKLRKAIANPEQAAAINNFSVLQSISGLLKRQKPEVKAATSTKSATKPKVTEQAIAIPDNPSPSVTAEEITAEKASKQTDLPATEETVTTKTPVKEPQEITKEPAEAATEVSKVSQPEAEAATSNQEPESLPQNPLPSKIPEVANQTENENIEDSAEEPASITPPEQSNQDKPATEIKVNSKSALESLETVEVAEVLEAIPENEASDRDSDPTNIIEVTTTEINQNQEDKSEH